MEHGDFESLVSRMEQLAREKPKLHRRRVFLLADREEVRAGRDLT